MMRLMYRKLIEQKWNSLSKEDKNSLKTKYSALKQQAWDDNVSAEVIRG